MDLAWLFNLLVSAPLLPPFNGLLLVLAGLLWRRRWLTGLGLALLWVLALPVVGQGLLRGLEGEALDLSKPHGAQAIVVLGGARYRDAPEYGHDTVNGVTLERVRYAAWLQRRTGLPVLVSGGRPDGGDLTEGEAMRRVLADEFRVPVRWVEGESINTRENATLSAAMLRSAGVQRVLLVTHGWHMPRAQRAFETAGLAVVPAPTRLHRQALGVQGWLPLGYEDARLALREWLGRAWYALRPAAGR